MHILILLVKHGVIISVYILSLALHIDLHYFFGFALHIFVYRKYHYIRYEEQNTAAYTGISKSAAYVNEQ